MSGVIAEAIGKAVASNRAKSVVETTANLAAAGVYTGGAFSTEGMEFIRPAAFCDKAGTLEVELSPDGVAFYATPSIAVGASTYTTGEVKVTMPYARIKFTNGDGVSATTTLVVSYGVA